MSDRSWCTILQVPYPYENFGFYYMPIILWGVGGLNTPPPPGISGSTYAMKLKLTPGMALNKKVH